MADELRETESANQLNTSDSVGLGAEGEAGVAVSLPTEALLKFADALEADGLGGVSVSGHAVSVADIRATLSNAAPIPEETAQ